MTYKLRFLPAALKEWEKLGAPIRSQFKKKLAERLENPRVPADKLSGYDSVYKIKLRSAGYRLAYEVVDDELFVAAELGVSCPVPRRRACPKAQGRV